MKIEKADYGRWQLPQNLEELSEGPSYPGILSEWKLDYIEHLAPDEDSETCLCTHFPIREVCHILNKQNAQTARVGNCCVKRFEKEDAGAINFEGTHKVFDSLKKLQKDENTRANKELLGYAYSKEVLTQQEYNRYLQIWRNRLFSADEKRLILTANRKIINHASSEAMRNLIAKQAAEKARKQAAQTPARNTVQNPVVPNRTFAQHFVQSPQATVSKTVNRVVAAQPMVAPVRTINQNTLMRLPQPEIVYPNSDLASQQSSDSVLTPFVPKKRKDQLLAELRAQRDRVADAQIVKEAHSQKILNKNEFKFYMQMVEFAGKSAMSPKQQSWLSALNQRILSQFKLGEPTPTRDREESTARQVKLANRQIVVDAYNNGLIKETDRDFYLGLFQRRGANLSEKQLRWVNNIHKRLRVEDDHTEANSNHHSIKRALTMETEFVDEAGK